jgi:hypothetical protein
MTERIRHIPWAYSDGAGFGHHYITLDPSLGTAEQFDIAVFPRGDDRRRAGDPMRDTPHIRVRTWDGDAWHEASVTPIPAAHGYSFDAEFALNDDGDVDWLMVENTVLVDERNWSLDPASDSKTSG